ncbi:hypothetical protein Sjap_024722 [Stephania japonica]|uniref:FAD-binding PCMH-type domain-containing protein n=1 Tax=Stephania japonica TaxID=461633 RepID=A0AAP0HQD8_9MAGN
MLNLINFHSINVDIEGEIAWVQAAATLGQLYYNIAEKSPIHAFPAGLGPPVGVGGHFSGGGFGSLMRKYGLSADNIIDARIVDANGKILDRRSMGEDLFWAIRGGGAASFGVVLSWKIKLVRVPSTVTVFTVTKTLEQGAIPLLHKWQYIAHKLPKDLAIMPGIAKINSTTQLSFTSLFLGKAEELLQIMQESFPELDLKREDCIETTWVRSTLYFFRLPYNGSLISLLDRIPIPRYSFKSVSDYVTKPIPKLALQELWRRTSEVDDLNIDFLPHGGRMSEIAESEIPYPHREGNIYFISYEVDWEKQGESIKNIEWMRNLYKYMSPYVSKQPRRAYLNYRDLDLGQNRIDGSASYEEAKIWGVKYFNSNFDRLVKVKSKVDPSNFFSNEQSIPSRNTGSALKSRSEYRVTLDQDSINVDIEGEIAWVQAAATLGQLYYNIVEKSPIHAFPAGLGPPVGVGGHFRGGGFGSLMRKYGLSADNIIDARIVDANGKILDRRSMGEDLFWAIRGGGAASFGVVLSWKIKLVRVPSTVTVFTVTKTLEQGAIPLLHKWQYIAPKLPKDLAIMPRIAKINSTRQLSFTSLFLGKVEELLQIMQESFPELDLKREDCIETTWVRSTLYFFRLPYNGSLSSLLDRIPIPRYPFKSVSDYVTEPIPKSALQELWRRTSEVDLPYISFIPYGGRMSEISKSKIPYPHREGNIYFISYEVDWIKEGESTKNIEWMRSLDKYMTPYVSKQPRRAYLNYRDLDLGQNKIDGSASYEEAKIWGIRDDSLKVHEDRRFAVNQGTLSYDCKPDKNGGHDYEGLSCTSNQKLPFVILDLINFQAIKVDVEDETAWVQSGVTLGQLYYKIEEKSSIHGFPAGIGTSVGFGGHFSGGGYGALMRKYGLVADNIVDAQIVNAKGEILDRRSMGEDLFWAIRGGGGSSFGVVLSWKIKLVRVPPTVTVFTVSKTLEQGAISLIHKWQYIAHKLPKDLMLISWLVKRNSTMQVSFLSMFLGKPKELLQIMQDSFPELLLLH